MPDIALRAVTDAHTVDEAFALVTDLGRFRELVPDVITDIAVERDRIGQVSHWAVAFHGGTLKWSERDHVDAGTRSMRFEQIHGDMAELCGEWRASHDADFTTLEFAASFDLGMPAVAEILDPIATSAFTSTITSVLKGLLGPQITIDTIPTGAVAR